MRKQAVDPLVVEAIKRAVEVEDLEVWGHEAPQRIPTFVALPSGVAHKPLGRRFISIISL